MRLYLSSYRLGRDAHRLLELCRSTAPRVLATLNGLDAVPAETRQSVYQRLVGDFATIGGTVRELDLRDYFRSSEALAGDLRDCDLVFAAGGNAFTLLSAMHQSGFARAVRSLLDADEVAYGGYSAGAVVAGPTLRGIELVDPADPAAAIPPGYAPEIYWDGLALVDYSIAPHYRSDHGESAAIEAVVQYFQNRGMPYRALRDGQAILVAGGTETLTGR